MNRNYGINFKYPRSSGGKFFQQKIDEGRSGLFQIFGLFAAATASSDVYFRWNGEDASQFGTGFWVDGGAPGLIRSSATLTLATSSAPQLPSIKLELNPLFTGSSQNVFLIPIFTGELPARYTIHFGSFKQTNTPQYGIGLCFGAVSASANSADFYGSGFMFPSSSAITTSEIFIIQSGSASMAQYGTVAFLDDQYPFNNFNTPASFEYNLELNSIVGGTSGSMWKIETESAYSVAETANIFSIRNTRSGSYGNWTGVQPLNSIYLAVKALSASTPTLSRFLHIDNFSIIKHPLDRSTNILR